MLCVENKCRRTVTTVYKANFCGFLSYSFAINSCEICCFEIGHFDRFYLFIYFLIQLHSFLCTFSLITLS